MTKIVSNKTQVENTARYILFRITWLHVLQRDNPLRMPGKY